MKIYIKTITIFLFCWMPSLSMAEPIDYNNLLTQYEQQARVINKQALAIMHQKSLGIPLSTVISNLKKTPNLNTLVFSDDNIAQIYNKKLSRHSVLQLYFMSLHNTLSNTHPPLIVTLNSQANDYQVQVPLADIIDFIGVGCNGVLKMFLDNIKQEQEQGTPLSVITPYIRNQHIASLNVILTDQAISDFYHHKTNETSLTLQCYSYFFNDYKALIK